MEGLTYESIRNEADGANYPREILAECQTALCLFTAAFYGRQDVFWVAEAGIPTLCVDIDAEKTWAMHDVYPDTFAFAVDDVYVFASKAVDRTVAWDLVNLDPKSDDFQRAADLVELWCALARKYVVLGTGATQLAQLVADGAPEDWQIRAAIHRSAYAGGTYWIVLERACSPS